MKQKRNWEKLVYCRDDRYTVDAYSTRFRIPANEIISDYFDYNYYFKLLAEN
jgi:hypothetical protein